LGRKAGSGREDGWTGLVPDRLAAERAKGIHSLWGPIGLLSTPVAFFEGFLDEISQVLLE
jgi:hypothetical protein